MATSPRGRAAAEDVVMGAMATRAAATGRLRALTRSKSSSRSVPSWSALASPVSSRYITPEAKKTEKKSNVDEASCVLRSVSSGTAMTEASDEFFSAEMLSLPSAGTIVRMACGAMIRRISTRGVIPSACPAITWPGLTPRTPLRRISAMNGASFAAIASDAAVTAPSVSPICGRAS